MKDMLTPRLHECFAEVYDKYHGKGLSFRYNVGVANEVDSARIERTFVWNFVVRRKPPAGPPSMPPAVRSRQYKSGASACA
jgi:hypothetical protein